MMIVHEFGHVLHAYLSGGRVSRVVLHPVAFSRTDLAENPHPIFVAWGGVLWGSLIPSGGWLIARKRRLAFLLRFFAGFCLIANGAYLAAAAAMPVGDAEDLIRLGVPAAVLIVVGLPMIAAGLALWNGVGRGFGFREERVEPGALWVVVVALAAIVAFMIAWSRLT